MTDRGKLADVRPIDANSIHYTTVISRQGINMYVAKASVDKIPTLDYAPVGRGQWEDGAFENSKRCTNCGRYSSKIFTYREAVFDYLFCPYCGKKCGKAKTHEQR